MVVVLFWLTAALVIAIIAKNKNRSPVGWFFIGAVISPLLAFILLMVLPQPTRPDVTDAEDEALSEYRRAIQDSRRKAAGS
jgi:hypothetical protein